LPIRFNFSMLRMHRASGEFYSALSASCMGSARTDMPISRANMIGTLQPIEALLCRTLLNAVERPRLASGKFRWRRAGTR
jgi:hypothetical protein